MNAENFTTWIFNQIIPGLPPQSIVVFDNALFHSKQLNKPPLQSALRHEIIDWLQRNRVEFDENL